MKDNLSKQVLNNSVAKEESSINWPDVLKELRNEDDFEKIISLIKKYKIIKECYQKAQHYINLASNSLTIFKDSKE